MRRASFLRVMVFALVVASLVMGQSMALFAQDSVDEGAANDAPAATEFQEEWNSGESPQGGASTQAKSAVQEQDRQVPAGDESGIPEDQKPSIYLPLISGFRGQQGNQPDGTSAYWRTIKYEGFEGAFPNTSWYAYDCLSGYGNYYWDDDDYKPYSGYWSAWAANGGTNALDPAVYYYPNRACSVMRYGPFSLQYAYAGRLAFRYWNQSELNWDYFAWQYSCNGVNWYGLRVSGNSAGWSSRTLNIPCVGDSTVWIRFTFTSDSSIVDDGPFVDSVYVQRYY